MGMYLCLKCIFVFFHEKWCIFTIKQTNLIICFQSVFDSSFECLKNTVEKVNVDNKTRLFNAEDECNSPYGQNTPFCKVELPVFISNQIFLFSASKIQQTAYPLETLIKGFY